MHHTSHEASHPEEDIVLRGDEDAHRGEVIDEIGEEEAR